MSGERAKGRREEKSHEPLQIEFDLHLFNPRFERVHYLRDVDPLVQLLHDLRAG